jgi:hypothetical protein
MREPGKSLRVYADTSVYGGVLDEEFAGPSRTFFEQVRAGYFRLVLSPLVRDELGAAPDRVQALFREILPIAEVADVTEEAVRLHQAYLAAAILVPKWEADALHVALATVSQCRVLVSWNFRQIVNFQKIPLYNGVNLASGYGVLGIHTPQEVIAYEEPEENL